jgi:hypothetical protein
MAKLWVAMLRRNSVHGFLDSGSREKRPDWEEENPIMQSRSAYGTNTD